MDQVWRGGGSTLRLDELVVALPSYNLRVGVSLEQPVGSLAAIVGRPPEGAAIARVVAGVARPESGHVWVGERNVTGLAPVDRQIGYVPAGDALLPHLTVRENVEYALRRREYVIEMAGDWQRVLFGQLELAPVLDRRPHELTAARRLRVALARAMVTLPEVLLIDLPEPDRAGVTLRELPELLERAQSPEATGHLSTVIITADRDAATIAEPVVHVTRVGAPP